jgi:hypothetical protein
MKIRVAVFAAGVLPLCAALSAPTCAATFNLNLLSDNGAFAGQNSFNSYSHADWISPLNISTAPGGPNGGIDTCLGGFGGCASTFPSDSLSHVFGRDPSAAGESLGPIIINDPGPDGFLGPNIITDPGPGIGPIIISDTGPGLTLASPQIGSALGPVIMNEPGLPSTPVPAALPLLASGLGIFGFLGLLRKWKASAVPAAR